MTRWRVAWTAILLLATLLPLQVVGAQDAGVDASPSRWRPKQGVKWQIQYSGTFKNIPGVKIYNVDLFDTPKSRITRLQNEGKRVICYFSAGSYEDWRPDAGNFPESQIGNAYEGWEGEWWIDIRRSTIKRIMKNRLDLAVTKGCDAVDPDNTNAYENDTGFPLTYDDELVYNKFLANEAHKRGLAIGLKNDLSQIGDLLRYFDFAVNEECFSYDECDLYAPFIAAGKPVYQIQYPPATLADFCTEAKALKFDAMLKNLELGPEYKPCA